MRVAPLDNTTPADRQRPLEPRCSGDTREQSLQPRAGMHSSCLFRVCHEQQVWRPAPAKLRHAVDVSLWPPRRGRPIGLRLRLLRRSLQHVLAQRLDIRPYCPHWCCRATAERLVGSRYSREFAPPACATLSACRRLRAPDRTRSPARATAGRTDKSRCGAVCETGRPRKLFFDHNRMMGPPPDRVLSSVSANSTGFCVFPCRIDAPYLT